MELIDEIEESSSHKENRVRRETTIPLDQYHQPKKLVIHTGSIVKSTSASQLAKVFPRRPSKKFSMVPDLNVDNEAWILVLYTGGTIGMKSNKGIYCPEQHYLPRAIRELPPLNDEKYIEKNYNYSSLKPFCLPPVRNTLKRIVYWVVEYEPLLDSSDMTFDDWIRIGVDIQKAYKSYDGFVVLHGTDTLAYTASALSFMLENLTKPVILTGSQIPVCEVRSDGRENLIGALIMAANYDIPEVTIFFNNKLYRGNRSVKLDNSGLEAFDSPNMLPIAHMEINIKVNYESIFRSQSSQPFSVCTTLCRNVGLLRIFPSISIELVKTFLQPPMEGVILQTYGAGNMPSRRTDIIEIIKEAHERGCIIVNCSQCLRGRVDVHYVTGKILYDVGVISGSDMTVESAITKLSYVLAKDEWDLQTKRKMMQRNIRGELTITNYDTLQDLEIIPQLAKFLHIHSTEEVQLLRNALFPPLLCYAAQNNDLDLLDNLRQSGAQFSQPDYNGRTALHIAAGAGRTQTVRYLLDHAANVNFKDQWGENALMHAVRSRNTECIQVLRDAGAVFGCDPIDIGSALCSATYREDYSDMDAWIKAGADINQTDYDGRTALHIAVTTRNEEMIEYLLRNGANINAIDRFGNTPLSFAENSEWESIVKLLKQKQRNRKENYVRFSVDC